jgi:hypothetical protein
MAREHFLSFYWITPGNTARIRSPCEKKTWASGNLTHGLTIMKTPKNLPWGWLLSVSKGGIG